MPHSWMEWTIIVVLSVFGVDRVVQLVLLIAKDIREIRKEYRAKRG